MAVNKHPSLENLHCSCGVDKLNSGLDNKYLGERKAEKEG